MATDATGVPTSLGIPKYDTSTDAPSGLGFNAAMDALNSILGNYVAKALITTAGDLLYGTGVGAVTRLGIGSTGNVLTVAGGVPSWAPVGSGSPSGSAGGDLAGSTYPNPVIATGAITSAKILDGAIVNADINAAAAIAPSKILGGVPVVVSGSVTGVNITSPSQDSVIAFSGFTVAPVVLVSYNTAPSAQDPLLLRPPSVQSVTTTAATLRAYASGTFNALRLDWVAIGS
jgi:hypothetical protein